MALLTLTKVADLRAEFLSGHYSALTRAAYVSDFRAFATWRQMEIDEALHELFARIPKSARQLAVRWKASMASNPDSTVRRRLGTLRSFSAFLHADGALPWYLDIESGVYRTKAQLEHAAPRDMDPPSEEDLKRIRSALCDNRSAEGRRLLAIFDLMNYRGLRISEILQMDVRHFDISEKSVRIRGKGRKELEWLKIPSAAVQSVRDWLEVRPPPYSGPLFVRVDRGAATTGRQLSRTTVVNGLDGIRDRLKIKKRLRPHGLRRAAIDSAIVDGAKNGVSLTRIQKWARHSSFNTTAGYARRLDGSEEDINDSVAKRFD